MTACMLMYNYSESGSDTESYYVQIRFGVLKSGQNGKAIQLTRFPLFVRLNSYDEVRPEFIDTIDRETFQKLYKKITKSSKLTIKSKTELIEREVERQNVPKATIWKNDNNVWKEHTEEEVVVSTPRPYISDYAFCIIRHVREQKCNGETINQQFQRFVIEKNDLTYNIDFYSNKAHEITYSVHISWENCLQDIDKETCMLVYAELTQIVQALIE